MELPSWIRRLLGRKEQQGEYAQRMDRFRRLGERPIETAEQTAPGGGAWRDEHERMRRIVEQQIPVDLQQGESEDDWRARLEREIAAAEQMIPRRASSQRLVLPEPDQVQYRKTEEGIEAIILRPRAYMLRTFDGARRVDLLDEQGGPTTYDLVWRASDGRERLAERGVFRIRCAERLVVREGPATFALGDGVLRLPRDADPAGFGLDPAAFVPGDYGALTAELDTHSIVLIDEASMRDRSEQLERFQLARTRAVRPYEHPEPVLRVEQARALVDIGAPSRARLDLDGYELEEIRTRHECAAERAQDVGYAVAAGRDAIIAAGERMLRGRGWLEHDYATRPTFVAPHPILDELAGEEEVARYNREHDPFFAITRGATMPIQYREHLASLSGVALDARLAELRERESTKPGSLHDLRHHARIAEMTGARLEAKIDALRAGASMEELLAEGLRAYE